MKFNQDFLRTYLSFAPLALALERAMECSLYVNQSIERPVLDIGCGEGLFAKVLFAEELETGIDPNSQELARARELGAYAELIQCEGAAIPKPDGSYRTILSNSVLEHIPDLEPVLREACRLLAPGGRFYVTLPSENFDRYSVLAQILATLRLHSLAIRYRTFYNRFWRHYHYYPLAKWTELAQRAGFEVVDAFCYGPRRICLIDDLLTPVAFPRLLVKRLTNRWVVFPRLRRVLSFPLYLFGRAVLPSDSRDPRGGLVFLVLTRRTRS